MGGESQGARIMNVRGIQRNQANLVTILVAFVIGWLLIALVEGRANALNAANLAVIIIVLLLIVRVINRADLVMVLIGLIVGILVGLLVPGLSARDLGGDYAILALAAIFLALRV
jgi:hypothetical protein